MSKTENIVNGFEFDDYEETIQAAKETEGVRYIREKTNMENPYVVLQIYNKMVSENLFETVVGYSFLKEMQNYLYDSPVISDEDIKPIRVSHPSVSNSSKDLTVPLQKGQPERINSQEEGQLRQTEKNAESSEKVTEKTRSKDKISHINYKQRFRMVSAICAALAVCIIVMFIIAGTGRSTTILNYENRLIDKYEAWEQELEQREAAVEERERQLGQD